MKYKLLIFDLDGTLLNTIGDLTTSVNYAMDSLYMPRRTEEEVLSFVGNGNRMLMLRCVRAGRQQAPWHLQESSGSGVTDPCVQADADPEVVDLALQKFHEYYSQHYADKTVAYDGIPELLAELKNSGYKLAVVSNKADYAVQDLCKLYFAGVFDFVIGDREGVRRKPAADPVDLARETIGAGKDQTLYIGDSEVDIETASNAGVACVSVDWGFRPHQTLIASGASVIISSPEQLKQFI